MARSSAARAPLPNHEAARREVERLAPAEALPPQWSRHYERMLKESLAFFASEVLGVELAPYMLEWDDLIRTHRRIAINAPRDHGKCHPGSTLVLRADGTRVRIDQWRGGHVLALDVGGKLRPAYAPPSRRNGRKSVLKITTRTGRVVEVTKNHPLLGYSGWVRADTVTRGDRIATPRVLLTSGSARFTRPWLAGLLIGDGGLTQTSVTVTTADPCVVGALSEEAKAAGWRLASKGKYGYCLSANWKRVGSPMAWTREIGISGKGSKTKRVPEALFSSCQEDVAEFLAGYLDSDGNVNQHAGGAVTYGSVNKELLQDVRHLLLRLGVVASLTASRSTYKGEPYISWVLTIRGDELVRFGKYVRPRGARAEQLAELLRYQRSKAACSGPCIDLFPKEVWAKVRHSEDWFRKRKLPRPNQAYAPTRAKLRKIAEAEGNAELLREVNSDVLWEEVLCVEDAGVQETWALCVPGPQNYVADDVINHNSTWWSYAYPIWRAWSEPGCETYIFSNTAEQAMEFLDIIVYGRNNLKGLLGTPQLSRLVPAEGRRDAKTRLKRTDVRLRNGSRIRAVGYGKAVRGAHPKYIVLDDPLNDEDMYSELVRKKHIEYYKSAIVQMVQPDGQIVAVGTPFHIADIWGWFRKNTEYVFRRYAAIFKDAKGRERALFPWRWPLKLLKKKAREIGSIAFARELKCEPVTDDLAIFPSWLFPPLFDKTLCCRPKRSLIRARGLNVFIGVDIARSASVGADYFVIFVIGVDALGNHYILDIQRHKGLKFKTQLDMITLAARRYGADLVVIEANAMQQVWSDEMIRTTDIPVKPFTTTAQNKYPLDKGVPSLRILLENQKLIIPRGDEYSVRVTDEWMEEMSQFGFIDGKLQGIGEHDDQVFAYWMSEEGAKMGGFSFGVGDEDEKKDAEAVETAQDDEMSGGVGDWEEDYLGSEDDEEEEGTGDGRDAEDDSLFESAFGDGKRGDDAL